MSAELLIQPRLQYASEADFIAAHPPYRIAVEAVTAAPHFVRKAKGPNGEEGPYHFIDHHAGVVRSATAAACLQAWEGIGRGLIGAFQDPDGKYSPTIVVNDCDEDVTLASYILLQAEQLLPPVLSGKPLDRFDELVRAESTLDTYGGIPPVHTPRMQRMMERLAWIFEPYYTYRANGELYDGNAEEHRLVIDAAARRIGMHIGGQALSSQLNKSYNLLGRASGCALIQRVGNHALLGASEDGHRAIISWQPRPDGEHHQYTYYRNSEFVPFDLLRLYAELNEAEGCAPAAGHGGSTDIGGSPRLAGSTIDPDRMLQIIASNPDIMPR